MFLAIRQRTFSAIGHRIVVDYLTLIENGGCSEGIIIFSVWHSPSKVERKDP